MQLEPNDTDGAGRLLAGMDRRGLLTGLAAALGALGAVRAQEATAGAAAPQTTPQASPQTSEVLDAGVDAVRRMTAKVTLNGQGPFDFVVDTGSNRTVVAAELAARLGLPAGPAARIHGIASPYEAPTARIDEVRIGGQRTSGVVAPLLTRADLAADGLIGIDMLRNRAVTMDFVADRLEIGRPGNTDVWSVSHPLSDEATVRARQKFGQLTIVDAEAGRSRMTCFLDTGAQGTVGNMALFRAVRATLPPEQTFQSVDVVLRGATGQTVPGVVALVPSMRIGGVRFTAFAIVFADLHTFSMWDLADQPALLIGMDVLRVFGGVTIDFGARQVRFRPAPGGGRVDRPRTPTR